MAKILLDTDQFLTIQDTMDALGIGYATVYRWIKADTLTAVKFNSRTLLLAAEVEALKKKRRAQSTGST